MYSTLIFIHSWTRWVVLISVIYFFFHAFQGWRNKMPWQISDNHFIWAFNQVLGYQVLFGITLWMGFSPITKAGFKNSSQILENPLLFFWTVRHALTMVTVYGTFHLGRAKARQVRVDERFKSYAITFGIILALILSAIPWPGLSYGRPLFRIGF